MTYSEIKTGEFGLDFKVVIKTGDFDGEQIEIKMEKNKKNNTRDLLEVSRYWAWDSTATEGFLGSFPRVREDDL